MPVIKTKKTNRFGELDKSSDLKTGKCVFPFVYRKKTYKTCHNKTTTKNGNWCATETGKDNKIITWAYCDRPTDKEKPKKVVTKPTPVPTPTPAPAPVIKIKPIINKVDELGINIEKGTYGLVIGNVQSGKTEVMIDYCVKSRSLGIITFFLVRNINADVLQLVKRIKEIQTDGKQFTSDEFRVVDQLVKKPVIPKKLTKQDVASIELGNTKVILGKMNIHDLLKFYYLARYKGFEFNLVIDEGDLLTGDDNENKRTLNYINNIISLPNRHHVLQVTATPLASILSSPKINYFYRLESPETYIGVLHERIKHRPVLGTDNNSPKNIEIMNSILREGIQKRICISLMISSTINKEQQEQIDIVLKSNPLYRGVIFNKQGIFVNGNTKKFNDISEAITHLVNSGERHIVIFAGYKASRGISFVSEDYTFHLTDLYIRSSEKLTGHCEELIQKLRILGKYPRENYIYRGEQERNLNIWTSPDLWMEINNCNSLIDKLTNRLVEHTKQGHKISNLEEINAIIREIELKNPELPNLALSRKEYDSMKNLEDVPNFVNELNDREDVDVKYDNIADGFYLKSQTDMLPCNHLTMNCDRVKNNIVSKLSRFTKGEFTESTGNSKLYNLFYADCILPENRDKIESLKRQYRELEGNKTAQNTKKNELAGELRKNCKKYVETHIFTNPKFIADLMSNDKYSQLKQYVERMGNLNVANFTFNNYLTADLDKARGAFRNYKTQIDKKIEGQNSHQWVFPGKPFEFTFGSKKYLYGDTTEPCPLLWSIYIPNDFIHDSISYSAGMVRNQIHYWHNLEGRTFIKPINSNIDRIYFESGAKFLQVKISDKKDARKISSLPNTLNNRKPSPEPQPNPFIPDPEIEFIMLHKRLRKLSSNELHKNPVLLKRYHYLRDIYLGSNGHDYSLKLIERIKPGISKLSNKVIGDMGCGNAKLQRELSELNIKSYDHEKLDPCVTVANMDKIPVKNDTFNILIYCLSLGWGSNEDLNNYLEEAYRIGKHDCEIVIICGIKREQYRIRERLEYNFNNRIRITNGDGLEHFGKYIELRCRIEKVDDSF